MLVQKLDSIFLIKISKYYLKEFDLFDKEQIQELFQQILTKIHKKYFLKGLLDVDVYVDPHYGLIIEIEPIDNYFDEIDLQIHFHLGLVFLNEVSSEDILNNKDIYYYKGKFYTFYQDYNDSQVIYKESDEILEKGIKITV